jgi:hypothetical protein
MRTPTGQRYGPVAKAAFRARRRRPCAGTAAGQGARHLGPGAPVLIAATTLATPGPTLRCCRMRWAVRCASKACAGAWRDPKGPASIDRARAALDRDGAVIGYTFVAHDCGLVINPDGLPRCIEGNVVQGASRATSEEVAFDRTKVTSTDWTSTSLRKLVYHPATPAQAESRAAS